jgi:hypothetical protein
LIPIRPGLKSNERAYTARDEEGAVAGFCDFGELPDVDPTKYVAVAAGYDPTSSAAGVAGSSWPRFSTSGVARTRRKRRWES